MTKPVEIVTINKLIPIFKDGNEANAINVVNFNFSNGDECGYNVISQKGLYEIGDKAIYIQPDYCLSDISLFDSFTKPNGEPNKSRLGKNSRIRAIKFTFSFKDKIDPIYSFGILMPIVEVKNYLGEFYDEENLINLLSITKYEESETSSSGQTKGDFPSFMYKTDEENQANLKSRIEKLCDGQTELGATIKTDGSSITIYFKKEDTWRYGICSRQQEKKTDQSYISEYLDVDGNSYHRFLHPETKQMGWRCDILDSFITNDEIESTTGLTKVTTKVKDSWVELANSTGIVESGMRYCQENDTQLVFRGEIYGQGLKGSCNKVNPDSGKKQGLILFGLDLIDSGFSVRQNYADKHNLKTVCESLGFDYTKPEIFTPSSYEEFCEFCESIITREKSDGRIIEGVVVRTMNSNKLSTKYMNSEYDAKK